MYQIMTFCPALYYLVLYGKSQNSSFKARIVRQYEHLGKSTATDKPLRHSDKDATAIRRHCHSLDNLASIDNFFMLGNATNYYHLSLK